MWLVEGDFSFCMCTACAIPKMCSCWLSHCAAKPPRQRTLQQALLCEPGADSDIFSPAHSEQVIRNARCFSALLSPPIERKISRTMAMSGGLGGSQKKPPGTYKQIFLHVINKSSFQRSKYSFKGEKYLCFYSILSKRPASLMELCIRTVQSTYFLLNFAVFANHSTSEKPFCFMWWFQNTDPCAEAIF